jgi:hypothetical protein
MEIVVTSFRDRKMEFQKVADASDAPMAPQRLKKEMDIVVIYKKEQRRFRNCFMLGQENELVEHCLFMEKLSGLKVRVLELRPLAFQFPVRRDVLSPFQDGIA